MSSQEQKSPVHMNRRRFLELGLSTGVALGSVVAVPRLAFGDAEKAAKRDTPRRTLVFLHLNGGNDGLNTVIPWKDDNYRRMRPSLAIDANRVLKIGDGLGFHPALGGLQTLWKKKRLAVVNGVGYPNPNYSHFRSTEIWFSAEPDKTPTYGWLGRALDQNPSKKPLRAVALQKEQPLSLAASKPGIVTMTDFGRFRVPQAMATAASLYKTYANRSDGARAEVGAAGEQAISVAKRISKLQPSGSGMYGPLGESLKKVVALLSAGLGLECIQISYGGFDTHSNQLPSHQRLLTQVGNNLRGFQDHIEKLGLGESVVTVVMSEFGRRVPENLSGGTDHGSAGPVFVIGKGIQHGTFGAQPSLEDLDRDNLKYTTDFRRVYAAVLKHALGMNPEPVLGAYKPLELFA